MIAGVRYGICAGGKSELQGAGRWLTASGGNPGKVPQKADRPGFGRGKGERVR